MMTDPTEVIASAMSFIPRFTLTGSDEQPPVDDEPDFGRRYDARDVCTPCWYDNCAGCRGSGCACRTFNHPDRVVIGTQQEMT
jgi:hypothetical protein